MAELEPRLNQKGKGLAVKQTYTAEVTDPLTGQVTVLVADSEAAVDRLVTELLEESYPLPVDDGAGSPEGAAAVRKTLKLAAAAAATSTRLVEVRHVDEQLVRIEIGCPASPRIGDLQVIAALEQQLVDVLPGRWQACWHPDAGTLLLTRTSNPT